MLKPLPNKAIYVILLKHLCEESVSLLAIKNSHLDHEEV
jgi:hypothetical protein